MKRFDLALRFAQFCRRGEALADRLSVYLTSQTEVGAVAWLAGLVTTTTWFSAAAIDGRDGAATKIAQLKNPGQDIGALLL